MEPTKFDSNLNPNEYLEWVQALERIFEGKVYNDETRGGSNLVRNLKALWTRVFSESYKQDIINRTFSLKQNNLSVGEYMREF